MFLNDTSKLFLNAAVVVDFALKRNVTGDLFSDSSNSKSTVGGAIGVGYSYKNTYFFELRYNTPRDIYENNNLTNLKINQLSFSVGYRIL